jgi:hypothetical protein
MTTFSLTELNRTSCKCVDCKNCGCTDGHRPIDGGYASIYNSRPYTCIAMSINLTSAYVHDTQPFCNLFMPKKIDEWGLND